MIKETPDGQTYFCKACEEHNRYGKTDNKHICSLEKLNVENHKCKEDIKGNCYSCGKSMLKDQKIDAWSEFDKLKIGKEIDNGLVIYRNEDEQVIKRFIKTNFIAKSDIKREIENKKFTNGETGYRNLKKLDKYSYNQGLLDLLEELDLE